jgi:hypothetical protein
MIRKPSDSQLRRDLIGEWSRTKKIERLAYRYLNDNRAARVLRHWYKLNNLFLKYIYWIRDGIHLTAYSTAIILASMGLVWHASILGSIGILISKRLTSEQVKMQARRMAYDSIEDRENQRREERRRKVSE